MRKIQLLSAGVLALGAALLPAHAGDLGVSFSVTPHVYVASSGYWHWNGHRHVWVERHDRHGHHDRHYRQHESRHHYSHAPRYRSHHHGHEYHQRYRKCG